MLNQIIVHIAFGHACLYSLPFLLYSLGVTSPCMPQAVVPWLLVKRCEAGGWGDKGSVCIWLRQLVPTDTGPGTCTWSHCHSLRTWDLVNKVSPTPGVGKLVTFGPRVPCHSHGYLNSCPQIKNCLFIASFTKFLPGSVFSIF